MLTWIAQNRQWLFSGAGVSAIAAAIVLFRIGYRKWRDSQITQSARVGHEAVKRRTLGSLLPGLLLRPFYSPAHVQDKVRIGLREDAPGDVNLSNPVPFVELYFQVTNLGPVDLVFDRAIVEVWFGQPTFTTAILERFIIPAGEITDGIRLRQTLADNQRAQVENFNKASGAGMSGRIHITVTAYFESKLGRISVRRSIERNRL